MGSSSSKGKLVQQEKEKHELDIEALKTQIENSKKEYEEWQKIHQAKLGELEKAMASKEKKETTEKKDVLTEKDAKINDLIKQVESLKNTNAQLEAKFLNISSSTTGLVGKQQLKVLSKAKVEEFVEQLLADDSVNISYLPDFVERQLYKNVLNLVLGLLDNTLSTTSVKFLGHVLTFDLVPDKSVAHKELIRNKEESEKLQLEEEKANVIIAEVVNKLITDVVVNDTPILCNEVVVNDTSILCNEVVPINQVPKDKEEMYN